MFLKCLTSVLFSAFLETVHFTLYLRKTAFCAVDRCFSNLSVFFLIWVQRVTLRLVIDVFKRFCSQQFTLKFRHRYTSFGFCALSFKLSPQNFLTLELFQIYSRYFAWFRRPIRRGNYFWIHSSITTPRNWLQFRTTYATKAFVFICNYRNIITLFFSNPTFLFCTRIKFLKHHALFNSVFSWFVLPN